MAQNAWQAFVYAKGLKHYMQIELKIWIPATRKIFMFLRLFCMNKFCNFVALTCEVSDSHSGVGEDSSLLGNETVLLGKSFLSSNFKM